MNTHDQALAEIVAHIADTVAIMAHMLAKLYDEKAWHGTGCSWLEYVELESSAMEFKHPELLLMVARLIEREHG